MARNKIDTNTQLFNILKKSLTKNDLSGFQSKLFIKSEEEHRDFLEHASTSKDGGYGDLITVSCHDGTKITELYYGDERFVFINKDFPYEIPLEAIVFLEQNSCIFTILAANGFILPKLTTSDATYIYDQYISYENDEAKGIDYLNISDYYDSFCILKITNSDMKDYSLERIACYLMNLSAGSDCIKKEYYSKYVGENINSLILNGDKSIPFDIILSGISSYNNPKNLFLELYRSIEKVYPDRYIRDLKDKLGVDICENKLSSCIEDVTGWRPKEESSLKLIIQSLDSSLINFAYLSLQSTKLEIASEQINVKEKLMQNSDLDSSERITFSKDLHDEKAKLLAARIYKIRNSLVHYRALLDKYIEDDDLFIVNGVLAALLERVYATD